jgi:hypothetical protein
MWRMRPACTNTGRRKLHAIITKAGKRLEQDDNFQQWSAANPYGRSFMRRVASCRTYNCVARSFRRQVIGQPNCVVHREV